MVKGEEGSASLWLALQESEARRVRYFSHLNATVASGGN